MTAGDAAGGQDHHADRTERVAAYWSGGFALVVLGVVVLAKLLLGIATEDLLLDPSVVEGFDDHVGAVSHLGVLLWVAGAAVALFTGGLLPRADPLRRLLLTAGAVTAFLALDDLFRGHENVGEAIGPTQADNAVVVLYGVVVLALLWPQRGVIRRCTPTAVLIAAVGAFAVSVAADVVLDHPDRYVTGALLLEDGSKLVGICLWTCYLALVARRALTAPASGAPLGVDPHASGTQARTSTVAAP